MNNNQQVEERVEAWIDNSRWNADRVKHVVVPSEVEDVLNIPLPLSPRDDILRWSFTRNGCTSVKSVYYRLRERGRIVDDESIAGRDLWSAI